MMYAIPKSKLKGQPPPWVHLYDDYTLDVQKPWDLCSEDSDCVPYLAQVTGKTSGHLPICPVC